MFQFTYYANEGTVAETALYRHYDTRGRLLYVGISLCAFTRTRQHKMQQPWFRQVTRIEIEWHATRSAAEAAEWAAIKNERPKHNQTFNRANPAPEPDQRIIAMNASFERIPDPVYQQPRPNRRELAAVRRANVQDRANA